MRKRTLPALALVCAALLAACSGGAPIEQIAAADGGSVAAPPVTVTNSAPLIAGVPPNSVEVGQQYAFRPTASDADGDALTFSIANKPSWADFDPQTGRLSGTPTTAHVGDFAGVAISVSDGKVSASLGAFAIRVNAAAAAPPTSSPPPGTPVTPPPAPAPAPPPAPSTPARRPTHPPAR